jgi:enoyl-CoA hydratase
MAVALDLTLTGREVPAQEALQLGLVSRVVPSSELMASAQACAEMILRNGQMAVRSAKQTIQDLVGRQLDDALRLEAINGYSSVGDFSEVRRRLDERFGMGKRAASHG